MQFRTREAVLHGIQLFGSDDDAHLFQLLQLQIRSVEFDFFELVGGNTMIVEGFKALGVFGIVGKAQQRLCNFAGLVGGDFQKMKRLGVFLRHETLDEGRDCGAVAKFVERRLVGRKRLCRRNLVLVAALLEVGNGLYGAVLLVVEQERFLVLRIGLLGSLVRVLILIFFGHKANVLSETKGSCREYRSMFSETMPMSAPVRSSPHRWIFFALSRPEKGLQKRVNLMQQKTNSDLSRHYLPRQLRHLILQEYLSGVKTARQLSEEHGIPMSTIHKMGQRWKAKNSCSFVSTPNPYPIMSRVTSEEASELLSENKALRRRLEEALLRLEGYEIMGDILQEEYGIDLLKKSAAGQSSVSKKDTQQ